jgi:hypothetical protein
MKSPVVVRARLAGSFVIGTWIAAFACGSGNGGAGGAGGGGGSSSPCPTGQIEFCLDSTMCSCQTPCTKDSDCSSPESCYGSLGYYEGGTGTPPGATCDGTSQCICTTLASYCSALFAQAPESTYAPCESSQPKCLETTVNTGCTLEGYVACGGSGCCLTTSPYFCPGPKTIDAAGVGMGSCYETITAAAAACPGACTACYGATP